MLRKEINNECNIRFDIDQSTMQRHVTRDLNRMGIGAYAVLCCNQVTGGAQTSFGDALEHSSELRSSEPNK